MNAQATRLKLLDDTDYHIVLDEGHAADMAGGDLQRICLASSATPGGVADVGGFGMLPDGRWTAWVSSQSSAKVDSGRRVVADGVDRMDAIVALWYSRHDAFVPHFCL